MLDVALLGTGGMMPLPNRYLTSLLCRINGKMLLIDCGEATQMTMKLMGWGYKSIDVICFTHFHGDHISGLPGLLLTIGNSDRTEPITLIGPVGLRRIVESLCVIAQDLPFEFNYIEIPYKSENDFSIVIGEFNIKAIALDHGMVCFGYSIEHLRKGKFDVEKAKQLPIPINFWSALQNGNSVEFEGKTYNPELVMGEERKGIKISYITDTRPTKNIPTFIYGSDLFICEGLYGDEEKWDKAKNHKHMVYSEAATLAKEGNVKELWLTHFSPAMPNPKEFLNVAEDIFPNSKVGFDRKCMTILFEE